MPWNTEGQPIQSWNRSQLEEIIEAHSILLPTPINCLSTKKLKMIVKDFVASNGNKLPELPVLSEFNCSIEDIIELVHSLHRLIHVIMGDDEPNVTMQGIDCFSRLYLSSLHKISKNMGVDNVFVTVWNAQSLLNLRHMYQRFGKIRNSWEGNLPGEGVIQNLKKESGKMSLKNWACASLHSLYKKRSFSMIRKDTDLESEQQGKKMFHTYKSIAEVERIIAQRGPISAFSHGEFHFVQLRDSIVKITVVKSHTDNIATWFTIAVGSEYDFGITNTIGDDIVPVVMLSNVQTAVTPCYYLMIFLYNIEGG